MNYRIFYRVSLPFVLVGLLVPQAMVAHSEQPHVSNNSESLLRKPVCYPAVTGSSNSVISPIEWDELQIEDLVMGIAEYTQTSLGAEGLRWLLVPVNDRTVIENRQLILRTLIEREDILNQLDTALIAIKRGESQLLKLNTIPSDINAVSAHFGVDWLNRRFNNSASWLDSNVWYHLSGVSSVLLIGAYLKLRNMKRNYNPYCIENKDEQRALSCQKCGEELTSQQQQQIINAKSIRVEYMGSAGDKAVAAENLVFNKEFFGEVLANNVGQRFVPLAERIRPFEYKLMAYFKVYSSQLASDAMVFLPLALLYWTVKELWVVLAQQQARYVDIAASTRALKILSAGITSLVQHTHCALTDHTKTLLYRKGWDKDVKDFIELLESSTFNDRSSWIYRRGNVVKACHLHCAVGSKLSPFLQTIAEWDAYCALAKMYKKVQHRQARYCFAEFVHSETPYVRIDHAWTPLARANDPVTNKVRIGADNCTTRMFLTGPNGCGKSTYMKALTHSVVLAQSCGLVPAASAQLALFDGIRTSLHPQEDVLNGISTFMAQKLRIDAVNSFALESNKKHNKVLVLFDEPFSGTTDAQIELRVHKLGQDMLRLPYAASCIATHVEKPTELALTGLFDNYQVEVEELSNGGFRRTFKIKPGVARWWFSDHEKVTRFVDWIGQYKKAPIIQPSH